MIEKLQRTLCWIHERWLLMILVLIRKLLCLPQHRQWWWLVFQLFCWKDIFKSHARSKKSYVWGFLNNLSSNSPTPPTPSYPSFFFNTSTKSWRGYIFTAVCLSVCVSDVFLLTKFQPNGWTDLDAVFAKWLLTALAQSLLKLVTMGQRSRSQWRNIHYFLIILC